MAGNVLRCCQIHLVLYPINIARDVPNSRPTYQFFFHTNMSRLLLQNTWFCYYKHGWRCSEGSIKNTCFCLTNMAVDDVSYKTPVFFCFFLSGLGLKTNNCVSVSETSSFYCEGWNAPLPGWRRQLDVLACRWSLRARECSSVCCPGGCACCRTWLQYIKAVNGQKSRRLSRWQRPLPVFYPPLFFSTTGVRAPLTSRERRGSSADSVDWPAWTPKWKTEPAQRRGASADAWPLWERTGETRSPEPARRRQPWAAAAIRSAVCPTWSKRRWRRN